MASIIWNRPNWGGGGGVASSLPSPDVKLLYVQTQPIVAVGPRAYNKPIVSIPLKKSELLGKSVQISFTASYTGSLADQTLMCLFANRGAYTWDVPTTPIIHRLPTTSPWMWTMEATLNCRADNTYIASCFRHDLASYTAWSAAAPAQPMPSAEDIELAFSVVLAEASEALTLEHAHVAIVG